MNATQPTIKSWTDDLDRVNRAEELAAQLRALLAATYGDAGEEFRALADDIQDNFMWCAARLADELATIMWVDGGRVA